MIKELTQACITTLINGYERQINNEHIQIYTRMALKGVIGDLGDFLDYVADFKEDVQTDEENTEDYSIYVRRIDELESENKELNLQVGCNKLTIDRFKTGEKLMWNEYTKQWERPVSANIELQKGLKELKSKLAEANESIENLKDNEKRLTITLGQAKTDLLVMEETKKKQFRSYQEAFQGTEKCNAELKTTNSMWQQSCNDLKEQNKKLMQHKNATDKTDWEATAKESWNQNNKLRNEIAKLTGPQWVE